jgi:hypothetical protein
MAQWLRVRQPSTSGNWALGMSGYSYGTPSDEGVARRVFVNAVVTEVFTQPATIPTLAWKDAPSAGYLMGLLTQQWPCRNVDGYPLSLSGLQSRNLLADGSGWFGAVDLPPGEYLLTVEVMTPSMTIGLPLTVSPGVVTELEVALPPCAFHGVHLPLVLK